MAFRDLREFVARLETAGELIRIQAPVSAQLEISEIVDRVSKGPLETNKALLFENVKGYDVPVLINAFGSARRMALALVAASGAAIAADRRSILSLQALVAGSARSVDAGGLEPRPTRAMVHSRRGGNGSAMAVHSSEYSPARRRPHGRPPREHPGAAVPEQGERPSRRLTDHETELRKRIAPERSGCTSTSTST